MTILNPTTESGWVLLAITHRAVPEVSTTVRVETVWKTRTCENKVTHSYTKSEPGAVATGSFPKCSTTPVTTKSA